MPRVDIAVPGIPRPLANYTPATRAGNLVFAAGQLASDFKGGVAPEARLDPAFPYYGSAIKKQTRFILENLAHTFKAAGTSLNHVVNARMPSRASSVSGQMFCANVSNSRAPRRSVSALW